MTILESLKNDDGIFKALELKTIQRLICYTDKGILALQIRKGEQNYHLTLDSVPLEKELNKTLMGLLFPVPKMDIAQPKTVMVKDVIQATKDIILEKRDMSNPKDWDKTILVPKKKAGRPKKVK